MQKIKFGDHEGFLLSATTVKKLFFPQKLSYLDGRHSVDRISCSLVIPIKKMVHSDGYR